MNKYCRVEVTVNNIVGKHFNPLTTTVLHCRSIDWFLYDEEHWSLMG